MMGRLQTNAGWFALALAALVASTPLARAEDGEAAATAREGGETKPNDVAEAERYAAEAYDAYERHDYPGAVSLYLQALRIAPSAGVLYNLARIYDAKLRDRELAANFYRRYITDPGADAEHVRIANERLLALRELAVSEAAASRPPPQAQPLPTAAHERARRLSSLQISGLATGALGLAGIGVGIAYGLSAKSDADVAKGMCNGDACRTQRGVDAAHDASNAATVATACFAAGGALVALGTGFLVFGGHGSAEADAAGVHFTPYASARGAGASLAGRW